jgi:hypothetical protein
MDMARFKRRSFQELRDSLISALVVRGIPLDRIHAILGSDWAWAGQKTTNIEVAQFSRLSNTVVRNGVKARNPP